MSKKSCKRHDWRPWETETPEFPRSGWGAPWSPFPARRWADPQTIKGINERHFDPDPDGIHRPFPGEVDFRGRKAKCTRPTGILLHANHVEAVTTGIKRRDGVFLWVRCRNCDMCCVASYCHWLHRAKAEAAAASWVRWWNLDFRDIKVWDPATQTFTTKQVTNAQVHDAVRHYFVRVREAATQRARRLTGDPNAPCPIFSEIWSIERGEQGTKRLHVHLLVFGFDSRPSDIPDYLWRHGPGGKWFAGHTKGGLIKGGPNDVERRVRYLLKYAMKGFGGERLPGGRRLGVSHLFGTGGLGRHKSRELPGAVRGLSAPTGVLTKWLWEQPWLESTRPAHPQEPSHWPENPPSGEGTHRAFNCALSTKEAPCRSNQSTARGPPTERTEALRDLLRSVGATTNNLRVIPFDEIPPEIVKAWGLKPEA